ncbi:MAG: tail fiber domain-containing protein [Phycisphaerales bacterium]|nr:tail fiber domain-containing protein [Phycisphaerales bacterium]
MRSTTVAILLGITTLAASAVAQTGSPFTYQGRVANNGAPVNGTVSVQLSLWRDAFSNSIADRIGSVQTLNNVAVNNGVFTVIANSLLEFGTNPFNGEARWLQVAVNGQTVLPRQQLLSTPYASGLTGGGGAINNSSGTTTFSFTNLSTNTTANTANALLVRRGNASGISLDGFYPAALSVDTANVNGVVSTSSAASAYSIFGLSSGNGGSGVVGQASGANSNGVLGISTEPGTSGVRGIANGGSANAVYGTSSGSFGAGLYAVATGPNGLGVLASASGTDGRAISASISGAATHAGYFSGPVFVSNRLGIGVLSPTVPLDVQVGSNQSIQFRLDSIVPGINVNTTGGNAGIMRLRNGLEIWPNDAGTKAGRLDVRNTTGATTIVLDGATGNINATGTITPSSARLKEHVTPIDDALERLLRLEGVRFDWIAPEAAKRGGKTHDLGFIAESVAKEFPEVAAFDPEGRVIGVDYARMSAVAVQAIRQQQAQRERDRAEIDRLAADNAAKQREIADLKARLDRLEARLR